MKLTGEQIEYLQKDVVPLLRSASNSEIYINLVVDALNELVELRKRTSEYAAVNNESKLVRLSNAQLAEMRRQVEDGYGLVGTLELLNEVEKLRSFVADYNEYRFRCSDTPGATKKLDDMLCALDDKADLFR